MALQGPILDNRSFEQLRDELVRRIPVFAPEWTDYNTSDPGIALLELFAYLGESLLFRFNQIPGATQLAFLRLLGVAPRSAQTASTLVQLTTERPDGVQVLPGTEARAGAVSFETDGEVVAWPLSAYAVGKVPAPEVEGNDAAARRERARRGDALARLQAVAVPAAGGTATAPANPVYYETRPVPSDPLDADQPVLDVDATVDQALWVGLLSSATTDPRALAGRAVFVGVVLDEQVRRSFDLEALDPGDVTRLGAERLTVDPPSVVWELWTGPPGAEQRPPFAELEVAGDSSRALTSTGVVSLVLPETFRPLPAGWSTTGDASSPPPLEDPALTDRVLGWLRARRPAGSADAMGRFRWVGANVVKVVQQRTASPELLGTGTGEAGQTYRLAHAPVLPGTVDLQVEEEDGWVPWTAVDDLAAADPLDRHYAVDLTEGSVSFGTRGRVPQIGQRIRVAGYRYGGGVAGNVPAGAITSLLGTAGVRAASLLPATGGADAATLDDALAEVPAEVHRRDRAVTADDFRALADQVAGVARAEVLPLLHPDTPGQPAAGVITVIVLPDHDARDPAAPLPDLALLRRVSAFLQPRRLLTTELYVVPPTYVDVAVSIGVQVRGGYPVDAVRRWVRQLLAQYLSPVPPYGPDGAGWPVGRAVRAAELEAVAVQVDGVEFVVDRLRLAWRRPQAGGAPGPWTEVPLVGLERWQLPRLATVTAVAGPAPEPGADDQPPPPDPVPVPLPPEVC
ncbi:MAG TPA: putative baseplate assembly protein [Actinomycetota bacterium]|jgi:predicted phage baseplate assembly protein|nr:putative baseplate assembly protein [Actinomycetota bacterium]